MSPREDIIVCDAKQSRYGAKKNCVRLSNGAPGFSRCIDETRADVLELVNCGVASLADVGRSRHDVPGFHAAGAYRHAQSMDGAEMSPVCGSKHAERSDVSPAVHLRRWIVRLRNRVTGICKVATPICLRPWLFEVTRAKRRPVIMVL